MQSFSLHIPTKIYFGNDKGLDFFSELKSRAKNVLLVTGGMSAKKNGYLDIVKKALSDNQIHFYEFDGIEPNPLNTTIDACFNTHKENNIDFVLGLGGGSVMDASKAISALLFLHKNNFGEEYPRDIWSYVLGSPLFNKLPGALPLGMIPTTAATASEVTPISVLSNYETKGKSTLRYEFLKPSISWLNPEFTKLLPPHVTADGAADIISHVIENYLLGGNKAVFTDRYCESIIKTVIETLPKLVADPYDVTSRAELLWCSSLALNGMHCVGRVASIFPLHAIEHSMSALKHELSHGRGLATLYPAYFKWLWHNDKARDRLNQLALEIFSINNNSGIAGLLFIERFECWLREHKLYQSAKSLGFSESDYQTIAAYTVKTYGDGVSLNILGTVKEKDIIDILKLTDEQK